MPSPSVWRGVVSAGAGLAVAGALAYTLHKAHLHYKHAVPLPLLCTGFANSDVLRSILHLHTVEVSYSKSVNEKDQVT